MQRNVSIDLARSYRDFRDQSRAAGFAKGPPEEVIVHDALTVTVATGAGTTVHFFDAASNTLTAKTQDPTIRKGQALPSNIVMGLWGLSVEFEQGNYGGTLTELADALSALGDSVLTVKANSERIIETRLTHILQGRPGSSAYTDTATATATVRGPVERGDGIVPLLVPRVCSPGSQLEASLTLAAAFTTNNDLVIKLNLGTWIARQGEAPRGLAGMRL